MFPMKTTGQKIWGCLIILQLIGLCIFVWVAVYTAIFLAQY
jgi:hypothetical protein